MLKKPSRSSSSSVLSSSSPSKHRTLSSLELSHNSGVWTMLATVSCPTSCWCEHAPQTQMGVCISSPSKTCMGPHFEHTVLPHNRQWSRRSQKLNWTPHTAHQGKSANCTCHLEHIIVTWVRAGNGVHSHTRTWPAPLCAVRTELAVERIKKYTSAPSFSDLLRDLHITPQGGRFTLPDSMAASAAPTLHSKMSLQSGVHLMRSFCRRDSASKRIQQWSKALSNEPSNVRTLSWLPFTRNIVTGSVFLWLVSSCLR